MDFETYFTGALQVLLQSSLIFIPFFISKGILKNNHKDDIIPLTKKEKLSEYKVSFIIVLVLVVGWLIIYDTKKSEGINYAKGASMYLVCLIGTLWGIGSAHRELKFIISKNAEKFKEEKIK